MIGVGPLGHVAILCAFVVAAYGLIATGASAVPGIGGKLPGLLDSGRGASVAVAAFVTLASAALVTALVTHDFSIGYVAEQSSETAPLAVTITGFWGGQAGSLLLWALGLALLSAFVVGRGAFPRVLLPGVSGSLFAIQLFFLGMLAFVADPFEALPVPAQSGQGLNPLLWDAAMRIHPPLLLTGYMSFSVPFAFAMGALISGRLGRDWLRPVRQWMLVAWAIQGAGLLAGAWWAYHVLGWGGYWGWDPVENVALLPWLTATAFLHSAMAQERRGVLKVWNLGLVIASFSLAIFGTFVVRSGIISSVHSFAESPIGPYFFGFLAAVLVVSVGLLFYRLPRLEPDGSFEGLVSREASFLLNNLLLVSIAAATFWGTIFPLLSQVVRGATVSVGPPFYQQVNGPLLLALFALMGVGPLLAWRKASPAMIWKNARWPLLFAGCVSLALLGLGVRQGLAVVAFGVIVFTLGTIVLEYWRGLRARRRSTREPYPVALVNLVGQARHRYGGYLVHLGMVLIGLGVVGSSFYQVEQTVTLASGQSLAIGRYDLIYEGLTERTDLGAQVNLARIAVRSDGRDLGMLEPERRVYPNWEQQPVSTVALKTTTPWLDDLYVLLTDWDDQQNATLRVFVNPLVSLIWAGGVLFLLGTLIAVWPKTSPVTEAAVPRPREVAVSEA